MARNLKDSHGFDFIQMSMPSILFSEIGSTEKMVANFFDQNLDSKCILFIDEIDAIFSQGKTQEKIAFQLISEFRRIVKQGRKLYVIATTNYMEKIPSSFLREGKAV